MSKCVGCMISAKVVRHAIANSGQRRFGNVDYCWSCHYSGSSVQSIVCVITVIDLTLEGSQ